MEIDVSAGSRLICELRLRLELDEDALSLVLSLLDQIYMGCAGRCRHGGAGARRRQAARRCGSAVLGALDK